MTSMPRSTILALAGCVSVLALAGTATAAPLSVGSRGPEVRTLNARLAELSYLPAGATSGRFTDATSHAVVAFQKQRSLPRTGIAGWKVLRALESATVPRPKTAGAGRRIEVSLAKQLAFLVRGDRVVRTIAISSAQPGYVTPRGQFSIYRKERMSWSTPYSVWLPWASYFTGGIAFHAYPDVPVYPASHGCVRVPTVFAPELYTFAVEGTPVIVR
jgi:peptidoglycan hydrolase-like protein with peptidoglycan-binding domain